MESKDLLAGDDVQAVEMLGQARRDMLGELHKIIVGQDQVIEEVLFGLFSRGHCLIVGVPGLAKTLLVKSIAQILNLQFSRIQFTPDLMPADIIGTDIIQEDPETARREFEFIKGPVFANMILADEINRTPPKTQAALLEAMQEYRVTVSGRTYQLDLPFFVLATQNPIEQEGTYPLPEAQLDRFMFNIMIDYPSADEEREIVKTTTVDAEPQLEPLIGQEHILQLQQVIRRLPVSDHVVDYAVALARGSRTDGDTPDFVKQWVAWGAGPRASQYLVLGAKARAVMQGRYNVSCKDVRAVAPPVLRHRIIPNFNAEAEGIDSNQIITRLLEAVPEPEE